LVLLNRRAWLGLLLTTFAAGCGSTTPAQPGATTAAAAAAVTASIVAPRSLTPANGALVPYGSQPVTLVAQNAISTQSGVTYTFEVGSDAAFATKVQTRDGVAEGAGGQTSVKIDPLAPSKDYFWHVRATSGGTTGGFGPASKLTVGPAIALSTPVPIAPLTNAQTGSKPALRVTNVTRSGPAGTITYKFELSTSLTFSAAVITAIVAEGVNETGFIPSTDLTLNTLYYWRATALDAANGIASATSAIQSFTPTSALWPGQFPPGTTGHASQGIGWQSQTSTSFDGHQFASPPLDESRVFDLLDRGFDPQGALDWMNSHGYPTQAVYYPSVRVIGFPYTYMAFVNGLWELVLRAGG
jgi:hypothetical protein